MMRIRQSGDAPQRPRRNWTGRWGIVGAIALCVAATGWWLALRAPRSSNLTTELQRAGQPPRRMHVAEVAPTDAMFREPVRAFSGGAACWRVAIRDAAAQPISAARVQVDVVAPDGAVRARPAATTGTDGLALFTYPLEEGEIAGVYTVRVVHVWHILRSDVVYDPAADTARSASFSVSLAERSRAAGSGNGPRKRGTAPSSSYDR